MGSYKGAWTARRACEEDNATALQGAAAPAAVTSAVQMSRAAPVGNAVRLRSERRVVSLGFVNVHMKLQTRLCKALEGSGCFSVPADRAMCRTPFLK